MKIIFTACFLFLHFIVSAQQMPVWTTADSAYNNSWKIFPVPARALLNLHYEGRAPLEGVISVMIRCVTSGIVFHRLRMASTTRSLSIPVANLGRGLYEIRVWVGQVPAFSRSFVK